jgi:hypothetical protein
MTPTLNTMININETTTTPTHTPTTTSMASQPDTTTLTTVIDVDETTVPLLSNPEGQGHSQVEQSRSPTGSSSVCSSWRESLTGEATGETTVAVTPVDALPLAPKASNLRQPVVRPHTGRNPTVERNTHKKSNEELTLNGNLLVSTRFPEG